MRIAKLVGIAIVAASIMWSCNENGSNEQKRPQPKKSLNEEPVQSSPQEQAQSPQQNQVQQPGQQAAPAEGEPDQYGREPGHAHYGHDHPPLDEEQNNQGQQSTPVQPQQGTPGQTQPAAPADGEPDQYGREPGHAHYGHDHPPLEEEQNNQNQQGSPIQVE